MWNITYSLSKLLPIRSTLVLHQTERSIKRWVGPTIKEINRRNRKVRPRIYPRNQFLDWNLDAELYAFSKRLGEEFDEALLKRAFTHRSYIVKEEMQQREVGIENPELRLKDNAELVAEGESFTADYVRGYLSTALPKFPEPGIRALTEHLTSAETIAKISKNLGTKDIILSDQLEPDQEVLAQTFKAIVAALAHSSGAERAGSFVRDFVITMLNDVDVNSVWNVEKPIDMLKDQLSKSGKEPEYRLIGQLGKNTIMACFRVGVYVDKEMFCYGFGENLAIAKEMAAREGLKKIFGTQDNMAPINYKMESILKDLSEEERKRISSAS